jgi:hypothetical protein
MNKQIQEGKPKEQELEELAKFIVTRPYIDWAMGDPIKAEEERIRVYAQELTKAFKAGQDQAIKTERNRIVEIMDSFIIEDEFYGKGQAEIQTELIINAIKIAIENNER